MLITPIAVNPSDLGIGVSAGPRSAGLHMSDIYGSLYQGLEPDRYDKSRPMNPLLLELGLEFESILEQSLKSRLTGVGERCGEFTTEEGIIYSPDLIIFNGHTRLGEIKLTFMSSREMPVEVTDAGFPAKFDKWLVQMKAYCYNLELNYARLYALFVYGDYDRSKGPNPQFRAWDIEFTARELKENWQMLMNHARHARLL